MTDTDVIKRFSDMMEFTEDGDGRPCFSSCYDSGGPFAQPQEIIDWLLSELATAREEGKREERERIKNIDINADEGVYNHRHTRIGELFGDLIDKEATP